MAAAPVEVVLLAKSMCRNARDFRSFPPGQDGRQAHRLFAE